MTISRILLSLCVLSLLVVPTASAQNVAPPLPSAGVAVEQRPPAEVPAPAAPQAPPVSVEAQIAAQTAIQAAKAKLWQEALDAANRAVALAPTWGHAYFVRAGIHMGIAGPQSELRRLEDVDLTFDYKQALKSIEAALNDLEAFDHFETDIDRRREVIEAVAQLRVRRAAITDLIPRVEEMRKDEAERVTGKVKNGDTAGHWCWPGQVWADGRCVGIPASCPTGYMANAQSQACELAACAPGKVRAGGVNCCWPGQGWSSERKTCVGVPQCPPGFGSRADLGLGESCVPQPTVRIHPDARLASHGCKDVLKIKRNTVYQFIIDAPDAIAALGGDPAAARKTLTAAAAASRSCMYYGDDASTGAALWCCPTEPGH